MTRRIISVVEKLCEEHGTRDPIELCNILGISTVYAELPFSVRGFYMECGNRQAIVIRRDLTFPENRYCAAHELGHALLHRHINTLFVTLHTRLPIEKYEHEADLFAAALLIDGTVLSNTESLEGICMQTAVPRDAAEQYINSFCKAKGR